MTAAEAGWLLLSSHLGDPERRCLTPAQLHRLALGLQSAGLRPRDRELEEQDLLRLGCGPARARQILALLKEQDRLEGYLRACRGAGCGVLTRISEHYPPVLRSRLGPDAPASLWYRGDLRLLESPLVSVVGSRDLAPENLEFAWEAGFQAAKQGFTLVSGNARGADRTAQDACLRAGGRVIAVLADSLTRHPERRNVLYLSEDSFDLPFSASRALSRNRIIHALPRLTLVAQCRPGAGGTWSGTAGNLRGAWSPVCCFDDASPGCAALEDLGATPIGLAALGDLPRLAQPQPRLF